MLIRTNTEKHHTQRNLSRQTKRITSHRSNGLTQPPYRPPTRINNPPPKISPLNSHHHLLGHTPHRRKHRTQTLMTAHHIHPRRTQRINIQTPPNRNAAAML
ncbi:hypothetical protein MMRN_32150 [Mycobacterium marinum]|nr:hypothetical protein MMRN_32150 [Mycobacterium marinum]